MIDMDTARKLVEDMLTDRATPDINTVRIVTGLLGNPDVEIVHLARTRGGATCGINTDAAVDLTAEHNDITCPLCFCIHEAVCESSDDESEFFDHDIDSIMATKSFILDCLTRVANRIGAPRHQRG